MDQSFEYWKTTDGRVGAWRTPGKKVYRVGNAVFVAVKYDWVNGQKNRRAAARLVGADVEASAEVGTVDIVWSWEFDDLVRFPGFSRHVPSPIMQVMQKHRHVRAEGNVGESVLMTSIVGDRRVLPLRPSTPQGAIADIDGDDSFVHAGSITFSFVQTDDSEFGQEPVDIIGWRSWGVRDTLASMLHSDYHSIKFRVLPQPRAADTFDSSVVPVVQRAGGPCLASGEMLETMASEAMASLIKYQMNGETRFMLCDGSLFDDPIRGTQWLTIKQLRAVATNPVTKRWLCATERRNLWLSSDRLLLPGFKRVKVKQSSISGVVRSFNESLEFDAELLFGPGVFIFPAAINRDTSLAPVRRFSPRAAALVLR